MNIGTMFGMRTDTFGARAIGIEIELEGGNSVALHENKEKHNIDDWSITGDPSLRDGVELVSVGGIQCDKQQYHIVESLPKLLEESRFQPTMRCGFHVHQDVTALTPEEFAKLIILYFFNEAHLFEVSGNRVSSNFCVPLFDCDLIPYATAVEELLTGVKCSSLPLDSAYKYRAMNFAPLRMYGTVEYRFMESTIDVQKIYGFVQKIQRLRELATITDLRDLNEDTLKIGSKFSLVNSDEDFNMNLFYHERSRAAALVLSELANNIK